RRPSLRRRARRAHRPSARGRLGVRPRLLLGPLRGSRRHPRRGEPRPREGPPGARRPARPGRRRAGDPLRGRGARRMTADGAAVQATITYIAPIVERPRYYQYDPPPGTPRRNTTPEPRVVSIRDARRAGSTLDADGFTLAPLTTTVADLYDTEA